MLITAKVIPNQFWMLGRSRNSTTPNSVENITMATLLIVKTDALFKFSCCSARNM